LKSPTALKRGFIIFELLACQLFNVLIPKSEQYIYYSTKNKSVGNADSLFCCYGERSFARPSLRSTIIIVEPDLDTYGDTTFASVVVINAVPWRAPPCSLWSQLMLLVRHDNPLRRKLMLRVLVEKSNWKISKGQQHSCKYIGYV